MRSLLARTVLLILVAGTATAAPSKTISLRGRIVAYRPVDLMSQVPSFAPNLDVFLFEVEEAEAGKAPFIVKVEYRHFGYSNLVDDAMVKPSPTTLRIRRNKACDEPYAHFLSSAPVIRDEKSGEVAVGGIVWAPEYTGAKPSPNTILKCYVLDGNGYQGSSH